MKKNSIMAAFVAIGMLSACNSMDSQTQEAHNEASEATADTAVAFENDQNPGMAADGSPVDVDGDLDWGNIDFNVSEVDWPEITDADVEVRGNDAYSIYALGEDILFATDQAELRPEAREKLEQISASIAQRSGQGQVRIYGYTDARASESYNLELAEQRANAVKQWLQDEGNIDASRLSVHPVGEARPEATNATAEGRQQNRRVEIVVRNANT